MGNLMGVSGVLHRLLYRSLFVAKTVMVLRRTWSKNSQAREGLYLWSLYCVAAV